METKKFDLNIEQVLENWEVEHALREIIANALDETALASTDDISIAKDDNGCWVIRDYGRGLRIEHFTMNENEEKLNSRAGVIGKFGVGLKDAIATLHRHGIAFHIESRHGIYRIEASQKAGFEEITTLHVIYSQPATPMDGTAFIFNNLSTSTLEAAKKMFLKFSNHQLIETVNYGQILARKDESASIYIHGVKVSEEPNFLFSYNITNLTEAMRKKLNRERANVGRTTYTDRVKAMLKDASSEKVLSALASQIEARNTKEYADELKWAEITQKALQALSSQRQIMYVTQEEMIERPEIVDSAKRDGFVLMVITEQEKTRLQNSNVDPTQGDAPSVLIENYIQSYNDSFQYEFVEPSQMTATERHIFSKAAEIIQLAGLSSDAVPQIRVSRTMRLDRDATLGVWDAKIGSIVINCSQLKSLAGFAGTLLHEVAHAKSGLPDVNRDFESWLTDYLGVTAAAALEGRHSGGSKGPKGGNVPKRKGGWLANLLGGIR